MEKESGPITFNVSLLKGEELTEDHVRTALNKAASDKDFVTKVKDNIANSGKAIMQGVKQQGHP